MEFIDAGADSRKPSAQDIAGTLALLVEPGQVVEIRAPKAKGPQFKRFTDLAAAARQAVKWSGKVPGVYWTLNPIRPDLDPSKAATDADILRRKWLLIDYDPTRPADTSATDEEKAKAFALAAEVLAFVHAKGFPDPIEADSGNGAHHLSS